MGSGACAIGTNEFFFVVECPVNKVPASRSKYYQAGYNMKMKPNSPIQYIDTEIKNLGLHGYTNVPPPALGMTSSFNLTCNAELDLSTDGGATFQHYATMASVDGSITHTSDAGSKEYYDTEILSMNLSGGTLPTGFMIRESPSLQSSGITIIELSGSGFDIASFFDVFTEVSLDGGSSWIPESNGSTTAFGNIWFSHPHLVPMGLNYFCIVTTCNGYGIRSEKSNQL